MIEPLTLQNLAFNEAEEEIIKIRDYAVSPDVHVDKPTPILSVIESYKTVDIFTEGNISMIQGQAKSRKSTFIKAICQAILNGSNNKLSSDYQRRQLAIVDTEQSMYDSYRAVKMIKDMTNVSIDYYNVSTLAQKQRKYLVEEHLRMNKNCGFIFLDNIVHFLRNFNDVEESNELLQWLIRIKNEYNVHICNVLHENASMEGGKARGHLGTNLQNLCETIIRIEKDKNNKSQSIISPKEMRGVEFEPFVLMVDYQGIPYLTDYERPERGKL